MSKKLTGIVVLMFMLAMFMSPTQVKACDAPGCIVEYGETIWDLEHVLEYLYEEALTHPEIIFNEYVISECGRYSVINIIVDFLEEDYETFQRSLVAIHSESIDNNIYFNFENFQHDMNALRSELMESLIYVSFEDFQRISDAHFSDLEIQPYIGCCLHQNIIASPRVIRVWLPQGNYLFCVGYNFHDNANRCLFCGHVENGRVTGSSPGCGMAVRIR